MVYQNFRRVALVTKPRPTTQELPMAGLNPGDRPLLPIPRAFLARFVVE